MRKFFNKYENFWEYEYPFGEDFLKSIFGDLYQLKYSLNGDGIFNLIIIQDKIYDIKFTKASSMMISDGKTAFRDSIKDGLVNKICQKLKENSIEYAVNSGKFITFKFNNFIMKIEIVKKATMPN